MSEKSEVLCNFGHAIEQYKWCRAPVIFSHARLTSTSKSAVCVMSCGIVLLTHAGLFSPRESNNRKQLPSAREVSIFINKQANIRSRSQEQSPINSLHMMQVGQFLDHDLTHAPAQGGVNGGKEPTICNHSTLRFLRRYGSVHYQSGIK